MPVLSTNTIASNICRSSLAGRPPLGWAGRCGIKGRTRSHNASLTCHGLVLVIALFFLLCSFELLFFSPPFYHIPASFRISSKGPHIPTAPHLSLQPLARD